MRNRVFNEDGSTDLVFVMGWGNRWTHENVSWLIGSLAEADFTVHTFELPRNISDFKADWVEPIAEYVVELEEYQLLAHSTGALIAQTLDGAQNHVYLSPWWGYSRAYPRVLLDLVAKIPTSFPFLPFRSVSKSVFGELATYHQLETHPRWVSPTFIRETRHVHTERLTIDHDAVVFCSLRDPLIDFAPIGREIPPEHVVLYDGGHELFSSASRREYIDLVISTLRDGPTAIEETPSIRV